MKRKYLKPFLLGPMVGLFVIGAYCFYHNIPFIISWLRPLGAFSPLLFVLIYCAASMLCVPTLLLVLAGGVLYGPIIGTLLNILGASLSAAVCFSISRYFKPNLFVFKSDAKWHRVVSKIERCDWRSVALLRLTPAVPFNIVNYCLGMTTIKFVPYLLTTVIFIIPYKVIATYCGYAGVHISLHSILW